MTKEDSLRKDRLLQILSIKGVKSAKDLATTGTSLYMNIYKQLFSDIDRSVSADVIAHILEQFPDVSADYIMRGEGPLERTKIVTPPQHRQDIHIAGGAKAAISQTGTATIEQDEPIGQESLSSLLEEKDRIIAELQCDIAVLKDAIRVLSSK